MSSNKVKEEKKYITKGQDGKQRTQQCTKRLEDIANHVQIKYNSNMARIIRDVE